MSVSEKKDEKGGRQGRKGGREGRSAEKGGRERDVKVTNDTAHNYKIVRFTAPAASNKT